VYEMIFFVVPVREFFHLSVKVQTELAAKVSE